jgi:signal transduction histidine kinase
VTDLIAVEDTTDPSAVVPAPPPKAPAWWRTPDFRKWRIRPKLVALVMIPVLAALLLAGLRINSGLAISAAYSRLATFARVLPALDNVVDALQAERDVSTALLVGSGAVDYSPLKPLRDKTDAAARTLTAQAKDVDTSHDRTLRAQLQEALGKLSGVGGIRDTVDSHSTAVAGNTNADYSATIQGLLNLTGQLSAHTGNGDIARRSLALQSLSGVKEAASEQRGILYGALLRGSFEGTATTLAAAHTTGNAFFISFQANTTPQGLAKYQSTVGGSSVDTVNRIVLLALATNTLKGLGTTSEDWWRASSEQISLLGKVQDNRRADLIAGIDSLRQHARNEAIASAAFVAVVLLLALIATVLVARSILRPLQRLRRSAHNIAYEQLPETVRQVQDGEIDGSSAHVEPISVPNNDEIGQVARAFDEVHTEAVRLAAQQAAMRTNVNKMFVNLSRRSQTLVERQLHLIDDLEAGEQDADQLANLFALDHLATRMRRNDENLLVLAGAEGGRQRKDPVPMLDVLRAASAEVEQYSRVRLTAQAGVELLGPAANDVIHLLAELLENATNFSPPSTLVRVRASNPHLDGDAVIEVEDEGIGMSAEELEAANEELASPRGMDVSMTALMGLFVVARLAQRHGISVQLRAARPHGVTAVVRLPAAILLTKDFSPLTDDAVKAQVPLASSPIFDALQSEWFTPHPPEPEILAPVAAMDRMSPAAVLASQPSNWASPGDEGWRVAQDIFSSSGSVEADAVTSAGLPVRVPGRQLIPGSASPQPAPAAAAATRAPSDARALSNFQQGVQRGRIGTPANGRHSQDDVRDQDDQEAR